MDEDCWLSEEDAHGLCPCHDFDLGSVGSIGGNAIGGNIELPQVDPGSGGSDVMEKYEHSEKEVAASGDTSLPTGRKSSKHKPMTGGIAGALVMAMALSTNVRPVDSLEMSESVRPSVQNRRSSILRWPSWVPVISELQEKGILSNTKLVGPRWYYGVPAEYCPEGNRLNGLLGREKAFQWYRDLVAETKHDEYLIPEIEKSAFFVQGKRLEGSQENVCTLANGKMVAARQRDYLVDSGSSYHVVGDDDITPEEEKTIRKLKTPLYLEAANGSTVATHEMKAYVKDLDLHVKAQRIASAVVSWSSGQRGQVQLCLGLFRT